jgi:peptidoglycan hydrolase CwlO-like protein
MNKDIIKSTILLSVATSVLTTLATVYLHSLLLDVLYNQDSFVDDYEVVMINDINNNVSTLSAEMEEKYRRLAFLNAKIVDLNNELNNLNPGTAQYNSLENMIKESEDEKILLESEIEASL